MTPLPPAPQVIKFQAVWAVDGDPMAMTVHYFKYTGSAPAPSDCSTFASTFVSTAESDFASLCSAHTGMNSCICTDLTSDTSAQAEAGTPWLGTRSGGLLSPGTATVVSHSIARRYRGGHPRTYLPCGTSTDVQTTGLWGTSFTDAVDAAWGSFVGSVSAFSSSGCNIEEIVNVSYYHGSTVVISPTTGRARNVPTKRSTPQIDPITGHTTLVKIGSQRRRNKNA